jgi:hypothetical protein
MGVAEFYYLEGGLLFGFLVAAGLAVVSLNTPNYRVARRCAWASALLFGSIAVVWGITTMESAWIRIPAVGAAGLIAAICLSEALRFIKEREFPSISPPPQAATVERTPAEGPWIEATRDSSVSTKGALIAGTAPFTGRFVKADDNSIVDMENMVMIGPDAPMVFPAPNGEYSNLSNAEFRSRTDDFIQRLRQFQSETDKENPYPSNIDPRSAEFWAARNKMKEARRKIAVTFETELGPAAKSLASELILRVRNTHLLETVSLSPDAQIGAQVILQNRFAGAKPANSAANFLDSFLRVFPN